ncbi:HD domain-containing protein [Paenibacillus sp. R14(2021)]|uniref:HD domain-containing protein n=1 Tax=Paenibacillus sp. R14(2021) TaxID=2859228 RepID=UPI001C612947|nr:HD domain-containing protein [Paenibacillus sp. R14(2021)]
MVANHARDRLPEEKVFKDPVHKYIYVQDQLIWDLINTREFQRLRRIRQLGASYLTFHGAEHSRFSHSLGVYEITRKIISQFERSGYPDWPKEEKLVALCAALLHDIGHGPFSHSIEDVFDTRHEEWTCRLLLEDTEINRVLRAFDRSYPERIASVICKTYHQPIVVSLVSSQMDADRMDYLLRDAYFTGVNYGTFDLERILRVLRPYQGRIVVKESGMHAVEDYLMSRYQMYWQVYFHPVTRSSEIILRQIFRRAMELYAGGYPFGWMMAPLEKLISGMIDLEDYIALDEALVQTAFSEWGKEHDFVLSDLCRRFLDRRLYKYVTMDQPNEALWQEIREQFSAIGLHPSYHLEIDFPFDMPYHVYRPGTAGMTENEEKPPILLLSGDDRLSEISGRSDIVRSITGIHQGKYHLYYPEEPLLQSVHLLSANIRELFALM